MRDDILDDRILLKFLQALGSESRLRIVRLLVESGPLCVGALACRLGMTQSAVSQHLRILDEAGLVTSERSGLQIHYAADAARLEDSVAGLAGALRRDRETGDGSTDCRGRRRSCADAREDAASRRT